MNETWITLAYLVASALFILGIKGLTSPRTAARGNRLAALGMLVAIVVTLLHQDIVRFEGIIAGVLIGTVIGVLSARLVKMTAMPQMVAIFNGLGGAASALVAAAELIRLNTAGLEISAFTSVPVVLATLIGAVTFTGSGVAFAKLQELVTGSAIVYPLQQATNALIGVGLLALAAAVVVEPTEMRVFWGLLALGSLLGVLLVIPIGGADMPVVISLLNSYSGHGSWSF